MARCEWAPKGKRCHATAKTFMHWSDVPLMKLCWDHADEAMADIRDRHAADGHLEDAIKGYAKWQETLARARAAEAN